MLMSTLRLSINIIGAKGLKMTKTNKSNDAVSPAIDLMLAMKEVGSKMMPGFGTGWVETMSDLGSEMLTFISERTKQDVQTQHDLLHAKDIAEIQHIQARFIQKAMDDYAAEMVKMKTVATRLGPVIIPS
jgi:hypothetical protein